MLHYILRRVLFIILVCISIVFFGHLGMNAVSLSETAGEKPEFSDHVVDAWSQTRQYLRLALQGELGIVETRTGPFLVEDILVFSYVNSMGLLLVSLAGAGAAGLLVGGFAALTKHKKLALPLLTFTVIGISTPSFVAGLLMQQGELVYLKTFGRPLVSMAGFGWDFRHMLLPVLVLSARPLAYLTRASFLAFHRVIEEDYIRTAQAKGLAWSRTVNVHALRNLAIPVLTAVGVSLRFSLSSLPVVEFFFAWPGMGMRLLEAIDARQPVLVVSLALAMGLTFLVVNLLLDLAFRVIDPRLREDR
jgi:peptide/nickel transport system permease protein